MAYRELELTLLSAQELKSVNLITRMDVYAVVSISGDPLTRQSTEADTYGGRNPCWDATFRFAVPPTAAAAAGASLQVLLRAERFLGDRDVGEVVVPLSDILASATGAGPQPPQVASYQVRKLHRWEPRGVLNVSYRLGAVVAPVVERAPDKPAANSNAYYYYSPVGVPPQPAHPHHPSAAAYEPAPPAPDRPAVRVAEHDEAAQNKSPAMGFPVGAPQQASHPPAKPDAYRPPASPPPPPPRPAAVRHEAARAPTPAPVPAPAPAPTPPPTTTNARNNAGPTHVYMGPHSQIIFNGSPPTRTGSPARSVISPAEKKGDGNWAFLHESMSMSVISPRSRKEDAWRPSLLSQSQSQHDTQQQQQQQQAASSPVAAPSHSPRLSAASPSFSRTSSFASSPLSPYSSAHPSPSSAHSSTRSPYPSNATSPHPSLRPSAISDATEVTHEANNSFRSTSARGGDISSPLPSSSPMMVPSHSRKAAVSSPLPSSSPLVSKHSSAVPLFRSELTLRDPPSVPN